MHTKVLVRIAIISRIIVATVQFIANHLIKDHDAGVFLSPKADKVNSFLDVCIESALGGFLRWDAQYFTHIAKYGYTYENTLAFFPLYPAQVAISARFLHYIFPVCSIDSLVLLIGVLLNCFLFVLATIALYRLSKMVLMREELAYKAALLFCFNPATIFFTAPYSETLFAYLTFSAIMNILRAYLNRCISWKSLFHIITIGLSTCTRSNGILNIGFLFYFLICFYYRKLNLRKHSLLSFFKALIILVSCLFFCILPFIMYQIYAYNLFCKDFNSSLSAELVEYAYKNNLVLQGKFSQNNQTWCHQTVPFAYSYIQDHYWNVGFLRYFTIKQIPNFVLAFPVTFLIIKCSYEFFKQYPSVLLDPFFSIEKSEKFLPRGAFVFIVHALFLAIFNFLCIHVQVSTRILCSASPVLFWYCAFILKDVPVKEFLRFKQNKVRLTVLQMFVKYYFLIYFVVGIILFCNFLPWT